MRIVVYPGTFDPITLGHMDIIQRASVLFDKIIIAVAPTNRKFPYFTLEERMHLASEVARQWDNVSVAKLEGLLVDFMQHCQAHIILRGLRTMSDFDYEFQMAHMNERLSQGVETVFLLSKQDNSYISSSIVREIIDIGGDISHFVPPVVLECVRKKKLQETK